VLFFFFGASKSSGFVALLVFVGFLAKVLIHYACLRNIGIGGQIAARKHHPVLFISNTAIYGGF
jgi:hypothetical protein